MSQDGVHATHCCIRHGCKYGARLDTESGEWVDDCPVVKGRVEQEYLCEACVDPLEARDQIRYLLAEIAFVEDFNKRKNAK